MKDLPRIVAQTPIDKTVMEFYEQKQQQEILKVKDEFVFEQILKGINTDTNGFFQMIASGSKGKNANLLHTCGAIGQVMIENTRVPEQFSHKRTSVFAPRYSADPIDFGFIPDNYINGMTNVGFIAQAQNNRFEIITKAFSTGISGAFMRVAVMNLQSCIVNNLRQLTKNTLVIQYIYGDDGAQSTFGERVYLTFAYTNEEYKFDGNKILSKFNQRLNDDRTKYRKILYKILSNKTDNAPIDYVLLPVNINKMITNMKIFNTKSKNDINVDGLDTDDLDNVLDKKVGGRKIEEYKNDINGKIEYLLEFLDHNLPYVFINEIQEKINQKFILKQLVYCLQLSGMNYVLKY